MGNKGSDTTTQTTGPDAQAMAAYRSLLERASGVASQPYTPYGGELTAPINAQQQLGIGSINQAAGFAQPYIQQAAGYATELGQGPSANDIAQYQSPYTQQVVDATMKQFALQNQQQQQGVLGNAVAQGALGGDRVGVAQANLAGQQTTAQAPVIAGLYNQGYNQALGAWQQGRGQAAGMLGNLGVSGQQAGLAGAGAQLGAGTVQQQNEQARLNALYQQFQQAQGFPYQQAQWLAGLQTGVGSQMGGTGTTTAPAPNPLNSILGLGMAGFGVAGGLGWKPLAARGGRILGFAAGGDTGAMPYSGVDWIPQIGLARGQGAPGAPRPPSHGQPADMTKGAAAFANALQKRGGVGSPTDIRYDAGVTSGVGDIMPGFESAYAGMGGMPIYRHGGAIRGFADGGSPYDFSDDAAPDILLPKPVRTISYGIGAQDLPFEDRWAPARDAVNVGDFDPQGMNNTSAYAPIERGLVSPRGFPGAEPGIDVPLPQARPDEAPSGVGPDEGWIPAPRETARVGPGADQGSYGLMATPTATAAPTPAQRSGFGLGWLPPDLKLPLMTAGLAMMASRSPHLGVAIGEGGLAGVGAYSQQQKLTQEKQEKERQFGLTEQRLTNETRRLDQAAEQARKMLELRTKETEIRQGRLEQENLKPTGTTTEDGHPIMYDSRRPGAAFDGITGQPLTGKEKIISAKNAEVSFSPETLTRMADQYIAGDISVKQNVGRGNQGSANLSALNNRIAERQVELGISGADQALKRSEFSGLTAGQRTLGTRTANIELAVTEATKLAPIALAASEKVSRSSFPLLNQVFLAGEKGIGDENVVRLGIAVNSLINVYARAINPTGVPTINDKEHARELLSAAWSKGQFNAGVDQLMIEMRAAQESPGAVMQKFRELHGTQPGAERSGAPAPAAAGMRPASGDQNAKAIQWANENPNDPRAAAIKKRLGVP